MSRSKRRPAAPAAVLRVLCVASLAAPLAAQAGGSPTAVSYTHLTLPTIYSV